jgi:hypothetical protein
MQRHVADQRESEAQCLLLDETARFLDRLVWFIGSRPVRRSNYIVLSFESQYQLLGAAAQKQARCYRATSTPRFAELYTGREAINQTIGCSDSLPKQKQARCFRATIGPRVSKIIVLIESPPQASVAPLQKSGEVRRDALLRTERVRSTRGGIL